MDNAKRFLKKLALFAAPFLLALAFFVAFEPYDYWLLKGEVGYSCRSLHSVRVMSSGKCENIILGNSLMANLNESYIDEVSGEDYDMLAYGGATLRESIDQFWYAAKHNDLKKAVFGIYFYTMNDNMYSERFGGIEKVAKNPLLFVGDITYWEDALLNFRVKLGALAAEVTGDASHIIHVDDPASLTQDTRPDETLNADGERANLVDYSQTILAQSTPYTGVNGYLKELLRIAAYCDENGIELTFVIFNSNHTIWENVITPLTIRTYTEYYSEQLAAVANVYDFEEYNEYCKNDDIFLDGFHLVLEEKQRLIRVIFGGEHDEYCKISLKA